MLLKFSETVPYSAVPEPSAKSVAVTPVPIPSNETVSVPNPPLMVSVPLPPARTSLRARPTNMSSPSLPNIRSSLFPPMSMSSPLPPMRVTPPVMVGGTPTCVASIVSDPSPPLTTNRSGDFEWNGMVKENVSSRSPRSKLAPPIKSLEKRIVKVSSTVKVWLSWKFSFPIASPASTIESPST